MPEGLYLSSQPSGFWAVCPDHSVSLCHRGRGTVRGLASPLERPLWRWLTSMATGSAISLAHHGLGWRAADCPSASVQPRQLGCRFLPIAPPSACGADPQRRHWGSKWRWQRRPSQLRRSGVGFLTWERSGFLLCASHRASLRVAACPAESTLSRLRPRRQSGSVRRGHHPSLRWTGILGSPSGQLRPPMQVIDTVAIPPR